MKLPSRLVKVLFFLIINISMCLLPMTFVKIADCSDITVNHRVHVEEEYIWVMGEVINNLNEPIGNVSVRIKCYDSDNILIEEDVTTVWLSVILSERRAPFAKGFDRMHLNEFTNCTVSIEHYEICEPKPKRLSISLATLTYIGPSGVEVDGLIKNDSAENLTSLIVIGIFYDDEGFLAASSDPIALPEGLSPGYEEVFMIFSKFVTQPSLFRKYILTAESKDYAIDQEKSKEFPPSENTGVDYRVIIIILAVMIIIASVIVTVKSRSKKRKRKPRAHAK